MPENEGAEFAPQEIVEETLPQDFPAETPVVDAEPEIVAEDIAPVEIKLSADISEERKPFVTRSADGGSIRETPFRNQ